jgi:kynurenine formamidase
MASVEDRAKALRTLKLDYEEKKEAAAEAQYEFKTAQSELLEYMDANNVEGVKTDGINFIPTKTVYGQITDRKAFVEWAEENDPELLEPKERKSVLNERARQLLDDGEEFPEGMTFRVEEYVSQRSA